MNLESRVAHWVDLGVMPYLEVHKLQERVVQLRQEGGIGDIILSVQCLPSVSFGTDSSNNKFSDQFIAKIKEIRGEDYSIDDVIRFLREMEIGFSHTDRSGGAAVIAPGQLLYFPIVDHRKITSRQLDVADYKRRIYQILFESLSGLGVEGIEVGSQQSYENRQERRDVWKKQNGVSLKMGSKGLRFSGNVAYGGFALFIDKKGTEPFWIVKPCGYEPDETRVTSVEEDLGKKIPYKKVHSQVRRSLGKNFGYDEIRDLSRNELYSMLERKGEVVVV